RRARRRRAGMAGVTRSDGALDPSLHGRVAVVVGAGQTPGSTIGNGRATSVLLARSGATVLAVDRDEASAAETGARIEAEGGAASTLRADVTDEADAERIARE